MGDGMIDLTGYPTETMVLSSSSFDSETAWSRLLSLCDKADTEPPLMGASIVVSGKTVDEKKRNPKRNGSCKGYGSSDSSSDSADLLSDSSEKGRAFKVKQSLIEVGLLPEHAYSILDVCSVVSFYVS